MDSSDTKAAEAPASAAPGKPARKEGWWDTIRFFLILFVGALIIRTFIAAPFNIPSGSMLPRLMIGDYLFVAKWPYGYSRYSMPFGIGGFSGRMLGSLPDRGDVVVFRHPADASEDYVVKRVIGLPGDTIQVRGGVLHLNGRPVQRTRVADYLMPVSANSPCRWVGQGPEPSRVSGGQSLCAFPQYRETLPDGRSYMVLDQGYTVGDDTPPIVVPAGHLFMMGDNRDDSLDSRFPMQVQGVGFLPVENVIGRVLITFFSTDGSASWVKPWTWFSAARWGRIGQTGG